MLKDEEGLSRVGEGKKLQKVHLLNNKKTKSRKLCESQGGKEEKTFRDLLMLSYALVKD
jgi:hypothetical protein